MKKITIFLLVLISILSFSSVVTVTAEDNVTQIANARYYVDQVVQRNELAYGVVHTLSKSYTSTQITGYDADGIGPYQGQVEADKYYPQQVNLLEVPTSTNVKVVTWANLNYHKWTLTTVKGLISDYEGKNPGWKVIAAVNGDFFDIGGNGNLPYQTSNSVVSQGEYYKTTTGNNVGITNNGTANSLIGGKPVRTQYMKLAVYDASGTIINQFNIEKINEAPGVNQTSVYYAFYGSDKVIIPKNVEVGSNNGYFIDNADLALPNNENSFYGKGTITSTESKTISTGQFALVTNNPDVISALSIGVKVRAQWEFSGEFAGVETVAGCGTTIMKDSLVLEDKGLDNRAPRTVIGKKADGTLVMMVVDGRQSQYNMFGADRTELAAIMAHYGVVDVYNLDGGGSSTVVIRQDGQYKVMNSPSDGRERNDANCMLIVAKDPELSIQFSERTTSSITMDIKVQNLNGHPINELIVEMNNEFKTVTDEVVTFTNLNSNTDYSYRLYYKDTNNELKRLIQDGKAKSLKLIPEYFGLEVYETAENFKIKILYLDPDKAATFTDAGIGINNRNTFLRNGEVTLKKSIIGYEITQLSVDYSFDINDGNRIVVKIAEADFTLYVTIDGYVSYINYKQNIFIDNIYQ